MKIGDSKVRVAKGHGKKFRSRLPPLSAESSIFGTHILYPNQHRLPNLLRKQPLMKIRDSKVRVAKDHGKKFRSRLPPLSAESSIFGTHKLSSY